MNDILLVLASPFPLCTHIARRRGCSPGAGRRGLLLAVALILAAILVAAYSPPARADGDPASDVLVSQVAFVPADAGVSGAQQARLTDLLRASARAGLPIRVALVPSSYDLGSITALWRRPGTYARFLGAELALVAAHHVVLVVMPDGVGLSWPGHSTESVRRLLSSLRVSPAGAGMVQAATAGVGRVLAAAHVSVAKSPSGATEGAGKPSTARNADGVSATLILIIAVALALLCGGVVLVWWSLRRRAQASSALGSAPPAAGPASARRPVWVIPVLTAVVASAIVAPVLGLLLSRAQSSSASGDSPAAQTGTPYLLAEGRKAAPSFTLRDQNGERFSLAAYHGRPVLLTFVDPLCRNLCPLEAHVLNALVRSLPASRRPVIVAVSVDVYADARHDLLQDFRRWSLVPQWRWAVGSHHELASIWKRYAIQVNVVNRTLAGTTVHYITHTEATYLIDRSGYERALFAWPFSPQDVLSTLRRVSNT